MNNIREDSEMTLIDATRQKPVQQRCTFTNEQLIKAVLDIQSVQYSTIL